MDTLERITSKRFFGYRSPSWHLSNNSIQLLQEYGFLYDSSMMAGDYNLYFIDAKGKHTGLVEVPVLWKLDDAPHFHFTFQPVYFTGLSAPSRVYDIWATEFEGA
jgi:peptidoglycan-N-acetylglucosamine deacetylase